MKNRKLQTFVGVMMFVAFLLSGCGNSKESKESKEKDLSTCDCSEITADGDKFFKDGKLYSGICETKDDHDVVIKQAEYVNGIIKNITVKERINDEYVEVKSIQYDGGKEYNGYARNIKESHGLKFTGFVSAYKNGEAEYYHLDVYNTEIAFGCDEKNLKLIYEVVNDNHKDVLSQVIKKAREYDSHFEVFSK
ncbi:MAG: hypothetical protein AB7V36_01085 [Bacteroidales bacterium]